MRVLMITGDKNIFTPGTSAYERAKLQRDAVSDLKIVFWGKGAVGIPKAQGYDVVTVQDPFWRGVVAWISARRAGARFNVQVHTDLSAQNFVRHIVGDIVLRHADSIRVVSEKIKKQVEALKCKAPIIVLPIYVDIERFRGLPRNRDLNIKTILWVGRFEAEKDPIHAISILEEVIKAGIKARLIMLGAGSMEKDLRERAEGLPVEFPGWSDPTPYLEKADVVISTSHHESWGASIVEALAYGVPVVSGDVGIAREAGAYVADRIDLPKKTIEIIKEDPKAELKIKLLSREEWVKKWSESL